MSVAFDPKKPISEAMARTIVICVTVIFVALAAMVFLKPQAPSPAAPAPKVYSPACATVETDSIWFALNC